MLLGHVRDPSREVPPCMAQSSESGHPLGDHGPWHLHSGRGAVDSINYGLSGFVHANEPTMRLTMQLAPLRRPGPSGAMLPGSQSLFFRPSGREAPGEPLRASHGLVGAAQDTSECG